MMKVLKCLQIPFIIIGLALIFLGISEIRSCVNENRTRELAVLEGQITTYKEKIAKEKEKFLEEKQQKEQKILQLKEEIIEIRRGSEELNRKISFKNKELEKLKSEFSLIGDKDFQIFNLKQQINFLEEKVSLLSDDRDMNKKESIRWKKAYEEQAIITEKLEEQLKRSEALVNLLEAKNFGLEKDNRKLKKISKVERWLAYGGFVAFTIQTLRRSK